MARQMADDFETKTIIKSKPGGYYQMKNDSKRMPYNIIFKGPSTYDVHIGRGEGVPQNKMK